MIEVEGLTKWYGTTLALDRATFAVQKGQIVGFLGPNGAGKTTALRILTGYMPATSGRAAVNGCDVFADSLAVRRGIGYMPENVPLYPEMRVEEYLALRASLKGVAGRQRRAAVDRVVQRCWLTEVRRRLISQLSKGYRQRVGLADSLVGDPPVLILDEPTIGLDPSQIQETRRLIRSLGGDHTVLLSSHILPEVEKTCSHLVIISAGRIAAAGSVEDLRRGSRDCHRIVLEARGERDGPAEMARAIAQAAGVADVRREDAGDGWQRFTVSSPRRIAPAADLPGRAAGEKDVREALVALAAQRGWRMREIYGQVPTLEDLYLEVVAGEAPAAAPAAA